MINLIEFSAQRLRCNNRYCKNNCDFKNRMRDIAEDGETVEDEIPNLVEINEYLKGLSKTLGEIEVLTERAIKIGQGGNGYV